MAIPVFTQDQINKAIPIGDTTTLPEVTVTASIDPTNTNPDAESYMDLPNPLHSYPSYTYSLSLHLLTKDEWNAIALSGEYTPSNVLIASAGRYDNSSFIRNQNFTDDFYIENLILNSVIGQTENNSGSNSIDLSFTIIEPYGVTLLDRIIDATKELNPPEPNYLEASYLLQIDFFGSDDTGTIVHPIPNQTKHIPIRILSMDINVTVKGAEYKFTACPYNHGAFSQATQQTPANFEITADTIQEFFSISEPPKGYTQDTRSEQVDNGYGQGTIYRKKSYASAVNAWNETLKNKKDLEVPDVIDFVFDPDIAKAKIVEKGKLPPKWAPYSDLSDKQAIAKGETTGLAADINFNIKTYAINSGSSIESVLNYVIKNSSYILDQIVNPADFNGDLNKYIAAKKNLENEPFWWYKIIPKVILLDYDKIRQKRGRLIQYHVVKYAIRNMKVDFAPGAKATKPLKVYNYIYTGLNRDILDIDIKFNAAYYTSVTSNAGKGLAEQGVAEQNESADKVDYSGQQDANAIQPVKIVPIVGDQRSQATGQAQSGKSVLAGDAVRSILNSSQGDMLNLSLKILGDPQYIKQDDIFYPPDQNDPQNLITDNGSIKTDGGQVYVQVSFNAPTDINESTGMVYYNPKYATSLFSGMYSVLTVESEFSRGQFTQKLEMVRLPNQPTLDYTSGTKKDSSLLERNSEFTQLPAINPNVITPDLANDLSLPNVNSVIENNLTQAVNASLPTVNQYSSAIKNQINDLSGVLNNAPTVAINNQNGPDLIGPPPLPGNVA